MMSSQKPHRIRVRVLDEKPREPNKLKGQLVPHVDVIDVNKKVEFVICAVKPSHLDQVRAKFGSAGIEEVPGGVVDIPPSTGGFRSSDHGPGGGRPAHQRSRQGQNPQRPAGADLSKKPYGFVRFPDTFATREPVWHDGTTSAGRLSGEVRCEMENLTPLLVGWERRTVVDEENAGDPWHVPFEWVDREKQIVDVLFGGRVRTIASKSVLCPLRVPWDDRPIVIPGDSLKGLLRHELGALLGAPMERVAERSYSYRPNSLFPKELNPRLVARLARVVEGAVELRELQSGVRVRVPTEMDLLPDDLKYDRKHELNPPRYRFDSASGGATYRGGLGAGTKLNSKRDPHVRLEADPDGPVTKVAVPTEVQDGYLNTLRHLADLGHGHFSERHPDVPNTVTGDDTRRRILRAAADEVFSPGDLVWVEWDTKKKRIVSLGWHYYYRWAYQDTVRQKGWNDERAGLFPLPKEKGAVPAELSAVRRLFGYTGDNDGSRGVGQGDHSQLMGRISVNAAMEVVPTGSKDEDRFLPPTFLKELGMPRPSAVEFYLEQPHHPNPRPWDQASLVTYGDAAGYDEPGQLAGRKFYLDRADAYTREPWKDDSDPNRLNDRSTLALEASQPHRRFRFTVRFRDLDPDELAALLLALCPHQFSEAVDGDHAEGYCSKLGYARPLGWGTVRIEAKELDVLDDATDRPVLAPVPDVPSWFETHFQAPPMLQPWLAVHRCKHPDAGDYPRSQKDGQIHTFHTTLRAEHTRWRRYDRTNS